MVGERWCISLAVWLLIKSTNNQINIYPKSLREEGVYDGITATGEHCQPVAADVDVDERVKLRFGAVAGGGVGWLVGGKWNALGCLPDNIVIKEILVELNGQPAGVVQQNDDEHHL